MSCQWGTMRRTRSGSWFSGLVQKSHEHQLKQYIHLKSTNFYRVFRCLNPCRIFLMSYKYRPVLNRITIASECAHFGGHGVGDMFYANFFDLKRCCDVELFWSRIQWHTSKRRLTKKVFFLWSLQLILPGRSDGSGSKASQTNYWGGGPGLIMQGSLL